MSGCRGCTGTCCTGLGSDPCVCPEPDEDDYTDDGDQLTSDQSDAMGRLARRALGLQSPAERLEQARAYGHRLVSKWCDDAPEGMSAEALDMRAVRGLHRAARKLHYNGHLNNPEMVASFEAIREAVLTRLGLSDLRK
jgi:hypothetical protein